jgi:hypothetical protein
MTQHAEDLDTDWALHWTRPQRGEWRADRHGRVVGEVRRDGEAYVATRGSRTLGTYPSLGAALDAVDHRPLRTVQPDRFWTLLLTTINVGIIAAIALVAGALLR